MIDSSGLLLWRRSSRGIEVLLAHMGGPYFTKKDDGGWTIPKGIVERDDADLEAEAEREFAEELGGPAPTGPTMSLGSTTSGGKRIHVFARSSDFDADHIVSNTFDLEWPPRSGRTQTFPEVDRAAWVSIDVAETKLAKNQRAFVGRLREALDD